MHVKHLAHLRGKARESSKNVHQLPSASKPSFGLLPTILFLARRYVEPMAGHDQTPVRPDLVVQSDQSLTVLLHGEVGDLPGDSLEAEDDSADVEEERLGELFPPLDEAKAGLFELPTAASRVSRRTRAPPAPQATG